MFLIKKKPSGDKIEVRTMVAQGKIRNYKDQKEAG